MKSMSHHLVQAVCSNALSALHRFEHGSVEGGIFADLVFMPMLFVLVIMGLFFALIGFYRIGASYATQQSALIGSVSPGTGQQALSTSWLNWTTYAGPDYGFSYNPSTRSAQSTLNTSGTFEYYGLGPWIMQIMGHTYTRSERFYPGGPVCNGTSCSE